MHVSPPSHAPPPHASGACGQPSRDLGVDCGLAPAPSSRRGSSVSSSAGDAPSSRVGRDHDGSAQCSVENVWRLSLTVSASPMIPPSVGNPPMPDTQSRNTTPVRLRDVMSAASTKTRTVSVGGAAGDIESSLRPRRARGPVTQGPEGGIMPHPMGIKSTVPSPNIVRRLIPALLPVIAATPVFTHSCVAAWPAGSAPGPLSGYQRSAWLHRLLSARRANLGRRCAVARAGSCVACRSSCPLLPGAGARWP